jgi:uncharacterized protein with von Willebrand factor type A (vWA) domain
MVATLKFDEILRTIQSSNLNFRLEMSPFSAIIHMKKSLVTNKSGISLLPPPAYSVLLDQEKSQNKILSQRIDYLEMEISALKCDYKKALLGQKVASENAVKLENELKTVQSEATLSVKMETSEEDLIIQLKEEKKDLERCLSENVEQISELDANNKKLEAVNITLNRELVVARTKSILTKCDQIKALKVEIKQWRKELGEERKQKIKLENAFSAPEVRIRESKELDTADVVEEKPVPAVLDPSLSTNLLMRILSVQFVLK